MNREERMSKEERMNREEQMVAGVQMVTEERVKAALEERVACVRRVDDVDNDLIGLYMKARSEGRVEAMRAYLEMLGVAPVSKRREALEGEVRSQYQKRGLNGPIFDEQISRLMTLWDAYQDAARSLREKGRVYVAVSANGKEYDKDNSACKDIVTLSRALTDMMEAMDITVESFVDEDEEGL